MLVAQPRESNPEKIRPEHKAMSMTTGSEGKVSAEINVTPMIDVLLVLLIIFLLIQPVARLGEKTDIPQPNKQDDKISNPIVIQLHNAGEDQAPTLKINEQEVSWNGLQSRLQEIYKYREEKIAFLKSDPEVDFQFVAEVVDITHFAGVDRVGLMTSKN
jgi:biopolymer transport protein TolR